MVEKLKVVCAECQGSGLRRYSDEARARAMQLSYGLAKHMAHKIQWLLNEMHSLDREVNTVLAEQLERV